MCEPVTIIAVAGLALGAMQGAQQNAAAKAQAKSANKSAVGSEERRQQNAVRANENFEEQIKRTRRKMGELKESSAQDALDARRSFLQARGSAMAAAASAGVEGTSIRDLIADFSATAGRNESIRSTNLNRQLAAVHDREKDLHAQTIARMESIPPPADTQGFSPIPGLLTAAGGAVKAYQGYQAAQPKVFTPTSTSAGLTIRGGEFDDGGLG